MKLWIRSQDRKVLLPVKLEIQATGSEKIGYLMYGLKDYSVNAITLGKYKTKDRALEVLDEIQNLLVEYVDLGNYSIDNKFTSRVYEMPKE